MSEAERDHAPKDALARVREAMLRAAIERRRYHALCLLDDFETWEDEVEYHGWIKAEELLTELAEELGILTEDVAATAEARLSLRS